MSRKETYDDVSYIAIIPISYAAGTHSLDYIHSSAIVGTVS